MNLLNKTGRLVVGTNVLFKIIFIYQAFIFIIDYNNMILYIKNEIQIST